MNGKLITPTILLLGACVLFVGCKTLRDNKDGDFLKPLDAATSPLSAVSNGANLSEREICVETARTVAEKGHAVEAIKLYEKAENLAPKGEPFDLELAPLYAHVGNTESAIARYRSAIARGHADDDVFNNLAWTLMESGRHAEAAQTIQQGLAAAPENRRLRATHAVILYKRGDRDESFETFRELDGASAAHHNLAVLDLDHGNPELASQQLDLATQLAGCSPESIALRDTLQSQLARATADRSLR